MTYEFGMGLAGSTMMAGMTLREMEIGKKYGGRVDMGITMMKWSP
jgi:hypothetical protein